MKKKVLNKILTCLLTCLLTVSGASSQEQFMGATAMDKGSGRLETGLVLLPGMAHSLGFETGMNGMSLEIAGLHSFGSSGMLKAALEAGFTGWGGQALIAAGYRTRGKHGLEGSVLNGLAFYRPQAAWVGGIQLSYAGTFLHGKKNALSLSAGMRISMQPAYRDYGSLWYYLDLPLRISWVRLRGPGVAE